MEKGKKVMGNEVSTDKEMKMKTLCPHFIEPYTTGEGLPYAPVDWPNPGDIWRWWVGSRTHRSGYYHDRALFLPNRLRVHGNSNLFRSKSSFKRYISSQFRNVDVEELCASFIWHVPSAKQRRSEDLHPDIFPQVPPVEIASKRTEEVPCNSKMSKKTEPAMSQAFPRRRTRQSYKIPAPASTSSDKSIDLCSLTDDSADDGSEYSEYGSELQVDLQAFPRRRTRQSYKIPAPASIRSDESVIDLCSLTDDSANDGSGYSEYGSEPQVDLQDLASDQNLDSSCYVSKDFEAQDMQNVQELHTQFCEEDFDPCLKSLEHISQHNVEAQAQVETPFTYPDKAVEMSTHRKKLSSILAMDFSCLLSSDCMNEISCLVEKLTADTANQLLKLKSIEEIPKVGEVFLHAKGIAEQATKFFEDVHAIKEKISSSKRKHCELKKEAGELQFQIDSQSSLMREIDEQMAQLQSRKSELARDFESKNKVKDQVIAEQKIMENSASAAMEEIQTAVAEIPIWEMKKKNAEKQMTEILAWYAPLKGMLSPVPPMPPPPLKTFSQK